MAKPNKALPKVMNQREAKSLLEDDGWTETLGGKHSVKMEKPGHRPITLPRHKGRKYSRDLTHRILSQAGLKGPVESAEEPEDAGAGR
jgi:predicted RNA binding protein YcfA (HicA-like mRNA interferase family)